MKRLLFDHLSLHPIKFVVFYDKEYLIKFRPLNFDWVFILPHLPDFHSIAQNNFL